MLSLLWNRIRGVASKSESSSDSDSDSDSEMSDTETDTTPLLPPLQKIRLHGYEDYTGFKVVNWCRHRDGRNLAPGVQALLHLQFPGRGSRLFGVGGDECVVHPPAMGLKDNTKYRTNMAYVTGVRFFGHAREVKQALLHFQQNRGYLLSTAYHRPYEYRLGKMHIEPRASPSMKEGCGAGLHFFKDAKSALAYGGYMPATIHYFRAPVVTKCLTEERGLVMCIPDEEEKEHEDLILEAVTSTPLENDIGKELREIMVSFVRKEVEVQLAKKKTKEE